MRKAFLILCLAVGCGPSASERYATESDVLTKLEMELHAAERDAGRGEFLTMVMESREKHMLGENEYGENLSQTKAEAEADLNAAIKAEPAAKKRFEELKVRVEAQRERVREAEEAL